MSGGMTPSAQRVPSYQRRIGVFWWVHKRSYFLFVMRELSSLFVAWFVVYLLMFIAAVGGGQEKYDAFLDRASSPLFLVVNAVALAFLVAAHGHVVRADAAGDGAEPRWPTRARHRDHRGAVRRPRRRVRVHLLAGGAGVKFRILPFVWLTFSGGGVIAAVFLPILVILLAFALPLGWVDPSHAHLEGVLENWFTRLALFALIVPMLVHAAHRFRYTVYDGLQIKQKFLVALACYGGAMALSLVGLLRARDGVGPARWLRTVRNRLSRNPARNLATVTRFQ